MAIDSAFRWPSAVSVAWVLLLTACSGAPSPVAETAPVTTETASASEVTEHEVSFDGGGHTVRGTLSRPTGEGPFPAVLLLAGSGPTDRDWNSPILPGTNGSGRLFAHALTNAGYVVLRFDKLGTGTTEIPADVRDGSRAITWADMAAEQAGALRTLAAEPSVDGRRIFVAGSSEGGAYALRLAMEPPVPLAGVALLAGPGRSQRVIVIEQLRHSFEASGQFAPEEITRQVDATAAALDRIMAGEAVDPSAVPVELGIQQLIAAYAAPSARPLARELLAFDPVSALSHFAVPLLILQGERDLQVDPDRDARALAEAARQLGRTDVQLALVEHADHVFKRQETPREQLGAEHALSYNAADRQLDPDAVRALVGWLDGVARRD